MWKWLIIVSQCSHTFLPELHPQWAILQSKGYFMPCITAQQMQAWPHRWPSTLIQPTHCKHSTCSRYGWNGSASSRRFRWIIRSWNKQASCMRSGRGRKFLGACPSVRPKPSQGYLFAYWIKKRDGSSGFRPSARLHLVCALLLSAAWNGGKLDQRYKNQTDGASQGSLERAIRLLNHYCYHPEVQ